MGSGLSSISQELHDAAINDLENYIEQLNHRSSSYSIPMPKLEEVYDRIKRENPNLKLLDVKEFEDKLRERIRFYKEKLEKELGDVASAHHEDKNEAQRLANDTKKQIHDIGSGFIYHYLENHENDEHDEKKEDKQTGGGDPYYQKYLKYKTKYLEVKSRLGNKN